MDEDLEKIFSESNTIEIKTHYYEPISNNTIIGDEYIVEVSKSENGKHEFGKIIKKSQWIRQQKLEKINKIDE